MKLGIVKRISKEDLKAGDLPAWIDPFLASINQFISSVGTALQGRLTFTDNVQSNIFVKKFSSGTELEINPQAGRLRVIGVVPLYSGGKSVDEFNWDYKTTGNIGVTFVFNGGGTANCRILVLTE